MLKPVWRMNAGNGVPSDLGRQVLSIEGVIYCPAEQNRLKNKSIWEHDQVNKVKPFVYAYQTNRTKAAKYERKDCLFCSVVDLSDGVVCSDCSGKGYTLEKINIDYDQHSQIEFLELLESEYAREGGVRPISKELASRSKLLRQRIQYVREAESTPDARWRK